MSELIVVAQEGDPEVNIKRHEVERGRNLFFPGRYNSPPTTIRVLEGTVQLGLGVGNEPEILTAPGPLERDQKTEFTTPGGYFDKRVKGPATFTESVVAEQQAKNADAA